MSTDRNAPRSKVARLLKKYDLSGLGDELEHRWTRREDRESLRDLADFFNKRLLRSALESVGEEPIGVEVDTLYTSLQGANLTSGERQQVRSQLREEGVDVDSLEDDFVTYQSMRTYLVKVREASPPDSSVSPGPHRERKYETIQQLRGRLRVVAENVLDELKQANHLTLGEFEVIVTVQIHCSDCEKSLPVSDLLTSGGCHCSGDRVR